MCVCACEKWFFTLTNKQKASNSAKKGCDLKNGDSTKKDNSEPI